MWKIKHLFCQLIYCVLFLSSSCINKRQEEKVVKQNGNKNFRIYGNYKICDSCKTRVFVSRANCLFSDEVNVESGILKIPNKILSNYKDSLISDSISMKRATVVNAFDYQTNQFVKNQVTLNTNKLYLKNFFSFPLFKSNNYFQIFEISGDVVEIKRRVFDNGIMDSLYTIYFSVDSLVATNKTKICGN